MQTLNDGNCDPRVAARLKTFVSFTILFTAAMGLIGLSGWIFDVPRLKTLLPGLIAIKANAAICLILVAVSLWLRRNEQQESRLARLTAGLSAVVALVAGGLSFVEHLSGWNFGIDQLLFLEAPANAAIPGHPGLMSPIAAIGFVLLGPALLVIDWTTPRFWPAQVLAFLAAVAALLGILDYVVNSSAPHTRISLLATTALFTFCLGLMCARPRWGLGRLLASRSLGGMLARRLLPLSIVVPVLIGWLRWYAELRGLYSDWGGLAIMILSMMVLLVTVTGWTALVIDRTDIQRQETVQQLHRASLYARSLIEASVDPLVTISKDGKIMDVNHATEAATGLTRAQLIGSDFSNYFTHPEQARNGYEQVFATGTVRDYALSLRHTSGRVMDVLYNATVFKNEAGEVEGVFAAARDVTERNRAESALLRSEQRYRSLVVATSQVIWTTNPEGEVAGDMPMWREFTGQTYEEMQGGGWIETVHPDDRERTAAVWSRAVKNRTLYDTDYRMRRRDGEYRYMMVRGVPLLEGDGSIREWIGTCTDVTERRKAEEEIRLLNEQLEHRVLQRTTQLEASNKELEAFTYSVSHDLRAPLRHIAGFAKMLAEEYESRLDENGRHYLQRVSEGVQRMGQLVDDLLNLARVGRKELGLQVTGLGSIVQEVIADLKPETEGRDIEWKIGNLPFVECDAALMKQVFQNLLSNSVKFTRPRPHAVIEVGQKEEDGVVFVRDNGVGFSMKYADKLFGVFQRLHRPEDFEGTGVGLATVQRIIAKHGGKIWAEAELDKGAAFYFTLAAANINLEKSKAAVAGAQ